MEKKQFGNITDTLRYIGVDNKDIREQYFKIQEVTIYEQDNQPIFGLIYLGDNKIDAMLIKDMSITQLLSDMPNYRMKRR